jgi:hypothetical protein
MAKLRRYQENRGIFTVVWFPSDLRVDIATGNPNGKLKTAQGPEQGANWGIGDQGIRAPPFAVRLRK